ncbi:hypothetical protein C8R43DRAFT_1017483 [Mycena crocata]|nr:hypothetical protein C8R43DRAFT_1017483 [Mycena crocata]
MVGIPTESTIGVGIPLLAILVVLGRSSTHCPNAESMKLQVIPWVGKYSTHPEAEATMVRGVAEGIVWNVKPASFVVAMVAGLRTWYRYVVAEPSASMVVPSGSIANVICPESNLGRPNCHKVTDVAPSP